MSTLALRQGSPEWDRFWAKVANGPASECWPWTAARMPRGYGVVGSRGGRTVLAHRVAWTLTFGSIPDGLCVLHHCDNPPCCNPAHLFLGTYADNNADMARKGRHAARVHPGWGVRGERHGMAKLTSADVDAIRSTTEPAVRIAQRLGVSPTTVKDVRRGRTWRAA